MIFARPAHADGELGWRIVSHLSLNYLSLLDDPANEGAAALREKRVARFPPEGIV